MRTSRIMKLHDYLDTLTTEQRKKFAADAEIDEKYLAQLKCSSKLNGDRFASLKVCKRFVDLSGGALTLEELRPDIFDPAPIKEVTSATA